MGIAEGLCDLGELPESLKLIGINALLGNFGGFSEIDS
jgi:hypothetical protein